MVVGNQGGSSSNGIAMGTHFMGICSCMGKHRSKVVLRDLLSFVPQSNFGSGEKLSPELYFDKG